jgi:multisubunit Na+/H+ antiporter MnhF subunit
MLNRKDFEKMNAFSTSEIIGTAIFALILAILAYRIIRGMPTMAGNITAFRKRTLVWTQVALVLTVLQLNFKAGDWRFAIILGLIVLFTGSVWWAARYYDMRRPAEAEPAQQENPEE